MRIGRSHILPALVLALCAGSVAAQQIIKLPDSTWVNDITPDGEVVVGSYSYDDGFIWRWRVEAAPTFILGGDMIAVSDDGSVVCGNITDPGTGLKVAAIWTAATGWQSIGALPGTGTGCGSLSSAYAISGDGTTVVGLSWGSVCKGLGFRWTAATGMQPLQNLANGGNRCSAISGDGSSLAGFAQGTFERTPAYWAPDTSGFVLDVNSQGEVYGLNQNGSKSVGTYLFGGANLSGFIRDTQSGAMTNLGKLTAGWNAGALDLSEDNSVIVGFDIKLTARKAWVWTSADGLKSLNERLLAAGIGGAPNLQVCRAVSDDGTVIVGGGDGGGPFGGAGFIVELPTLEPHWIDLGNGLAGTNGIPSLEGIGVLTTGSNTRVILTQAKPGSHCAFVVGLSTIYAQFKQGVLVPFPSLVTTIPAVPASGSVSLQFPWPAGLPNHFSAYWQCVVSDPAGPAGFALSNALQSTTP